MLEEAITELEDARPPALPADRLWSEAQAAAYFQKGPGWLHAHVPCVALPSAGRRRARRYRPETCRALAGQWETAPRSREEGA